MALTNTVKTDLYRFFNVAFDAAPGVTYMNQLADAAAVMTIPQIVEEFTKKAEFTSVYPKFFTNEQFAAKLVENVVGNSATAAAKAEAAADIVASLALGGEWTRGKVIHTIFNNLANKPLDDATWGNTAKQMANQVAYAQYYTEELLGDTTNLATLRAVIANVTATSSTATADIAAALTPAAPAPVAQAFTLTTGVDNPSGGAGDDTISGILGNTASFSVGDNINGGAGNDTLNLIAAQHTANGLVSMDGVETVNVRLVGTAAETVELNAADWSGVAVLSNASSLAATTLEVSGLESTTNIVLNGNTDVSVQYASTTTANAVGTLVDAGTFAGATDIFASATANATAHLDFDLENAGLVSGIAVTISGTNNYARLEGGSNAEAYTVNGAGNATLVTDDLVVTFNAAAASGNLDITLQGASEAVVTGGAGNDTLRLGTTLSNNDSFNGGAGTDTIRATVAGFNRNLNTTNVESATITFTGGGELNASASTITSYSVSAGAAGVSAAITQIANGATIALTNDDLGGVTLDFASGAASTTITVGTAATASADVALASLAVTDVASVTLNAVAGVSAGATASIATATFDTDVKSIVVQTLGGTGSFEIGDGGNASIGGATALTFNANGAANINFDSVIAGGSTLTTLNVNTLGTTAASATLVAVGGTAISTINLNASGAGDIEIGAVSLGNGASAAGAVATINVTQGVEQDTTIGDIATTGGIALTINAPTIQSSGSLVLNDLTIAQGSSTALPMSVTFNAMTISTGASFEIDGIDLEGSATGAQVNIGTITMASGASLDFGSASGISAEGYANIDVSSITLVMGNSATANFGTIETIGGAVGNVSVTLGDGATATFGAVSASAIGSHSLVLASGASASFGNIVAFSGGNANQGAKGAIEISGVDGADVSFGTIAASAVGAISVSGALDVTFGQITTTNMGEVNATGLGASGSFTIDLSGVTNAVEVKLGVASNTVISGLGNDVITLTGGRTAAAGNDVIRFTATGQGTDNIINFIAGNAASGGDQIELATGMTTATLFNVDGEAIANADAVDLSVVMTATADTLVATDNVIVIGTALSTTAGMLDFLDGVTMTTAAQGSATYVVAWTDGADTYVSLVDAIGAGSAAATTLASGGHTLSVSTLTVLSGVTPGALVAANFDFV